MDRLWVTQRSRLKHCAKLQKVAGSIPDRIFEIFHWLHRPHYGQVDSASNRNEYQRFSLGSKNGRCVGLTTLPPSCADCMKILEASTTRSALDSLYRYRITYGLFCPTAISNWQILKKNISRNKNTPDTLLFATTDKLCSQSTQQLCHTNALCQDTPSKAARICSLLTIWCGGLGLLHVSK